MCIYGNEYSAGGMITERAMSEIACFGEELVGVPKSYRGFEVTP